MRRTALSLFGVVIIIGLIGITGCGSVPTNPAQIIGQIQNGTIGQNSGTSNGSGLLRNENWLIGTWSATVPKSDSSNFAGKKINLKIASVMLISDEKVQGRPTGKFAYSGNLIWDVGGKEKTLVFIKEDWTTGDGSLIWEYMSPGADQFLENISMRVYDLTFSFELDWGPQISKPGSTFSSLSFYGSIQNLDTSAKDEFDPGNMINFTQTSNTAPNMISTNPTATSSGSSPTKTATSTSTPSPTKTTSTGSGTRDIWSDIPIYPNALKAEDQGFGLSSGGDPSYSQIEWHFFASSDDIAKVADFYTKQMPAKGWTKDSWANIGEMAYGSFNKNNETRLCSINLIKAEGGTAINIMSAAK
jgi:hypothetical protein